MFLTKKQNAVINCLQNGYQLITTSLQTSVIVGNAQYQFEIGPRTFWNLVKKGLIHQINSHPFDYVLTDFGKEIKTKDINIEDYI